MDNPGAHSTFKYPFPVSSGIDRGRMLSLVEKHWRLNRTAVNPDTDRLVEYLRKQLNADVVEADSGEECLTWRIPQRWQVRTGKLKKRDGTVVADYGDNPLTLWTHSSSFRGEISLDELLKNHVSTDPKRPFEIPYHFRNGYSHGASGWGFSLPYRVVEKLDEPAYEVEIDVDLDYEGTIKVVDSFLPGQLDDTIFIMAHTCHPAQVSDGIACIAIAAELSHYLSTLPQRRYSYRFLFGPEYFAAAAYLSHAGAEDVNNLRFGIFLDMLSNHEVIGFQHSLQGNSLMDKVCRNVLKSHTQTFLERPYRELWGNDETFYNGPGFLKPTIGIGRGMHREYHYDSDNLENINMYHMVESVWYLMRITEVFETDYIPLRRFEGPIYLSKYGLYIDPNLEPQEADRIERMQSAIDGERSCFDIADDFGVDFFFVRDFFDKLAENDLIAKTSRPPRESDKGTLELAEQIKYLD